MEQGLFRSELTAVLDRYGHLLWRRCRLAVDRPEHGDRVFGLFVHRISEVGAELRGREDKLGWLVEVLGQVLKAEGLAPRHDALAGRVHPLEARHVGDPEALGSPPHSVVTDTEFGKELDRARQDFAAQVDLQTLLDEVFADAPLPSRVGRRWRGPALLAGAFVSLLLVAGLWPSPAGQHAVPEAFLLTALVEKSGRLDRTHGPEFLLEGGEDIQVELSIPVAQTVNVFVLEEGGELTPLALGRLFPPGVHRLPQTLLAGPPALVRTATRTGRFDEVFTIRLRAPGVPRR